MSLGVPRTPEFAFLFILFMPGVHWTSREEEEEERVRMVFPTKCLSSTTSGQVTLRNSIKVSLHRQDLFLIQQWEQLSLTKTVGSIACSGCICCNELKKRWKHLRHFP